MCIYAASIAIRALLHRDIEQNGCCLNDFIESLGVKEKKVENGVNDVNNSENEETREKVGDCEGKGKEIDVWQDIVDAVNG